MKLYPVNGFEHSNPLSQFSNFPYSSKGAEKYLGNHSIRKWQKNAMIHNLCEFDEGGLLWLKYDADSTWWGWLIGWKLPYILAYKAISHIRRPHQFALKIASKVTPAYQTTPPPTLAMLQIKYIHHAHPTITSGLCQKTTGSLSLKPARLGENVVHTFGCTARSSVVTNDMFFTPLETLLAQQLALLTGVIST